jgi:hypothetical protein
MFAQQVADAVTRAHTLTRLDHLSRSIWQAMVANAVSDEQAQNLAELIHTRRSVVRGDLKPVGIPPGRSSIFPPRRLQRPPLRPIAIARRRHLAASGPMPPALACRFTVGELAVLRIVGDEVRQHGHCDRTLGEIAARAGVSRSTAKNAIRAAAAMGLLTVQERRREGRVNLPNVLRVVSREWLQWLSKRAGRANRSMGEGRGVKNVTPTAREGIRRGGQTAPASIAAERQQADRTEPRRESGGAIGIAGANRGGDGQ